MDILTLREAGLTEGEIKVYLALLELGSSTTGPIIDKSNVSRSIIYTLLGNLMEKGLASYVTKDKTKYFQAAEPQKILDYVEERENKLQENKKKIEQMLPELMLKKGMAKESEVNVYTGVKGMMTAHEHTYSKLKKGEEYVYLGIPAEQPEPHHMYWKRDHIRRAKAEISCRLLFNQDTDNKIVKNRDSFKLCEARYMPIGIITPACFLIYKDTTVVLIQGADTLAIEIVNQKVADSFKAYFEEFWKLSKKFKK